VVVVERRGEELVLRAAIHEAVDPAIEGEQSFIAFGLPHRVELGDQLLRLASVVGSRALCSEPRSP